MEDHPLDQTKVLSIKISCCEKCPGILKKKLLKMPGVDSVVVNTEQDLVLVTGTIDAMTLVNKVAKFGKKVQLLPSEKHHKNKHHHHVNGKQKNVTDEGHGCCNMEHDFTAKQKGKTHKTDCCQGHYQDPKKEKEHKCEAYVPPKVDERVCRDYYCKIHALRKITDQVPAESSNFYGGLPVYNFGGVDPFRSMHSQPAWYGDVPHQFVYHQQPRRMLPRPFFQ